MSGTKITPFVPFWFEGTILGGRKLIFSENDWIDRVVEPYARVFPNLPLDAVMISPGGEETPPVFSLHYKNGVRLSTWAERHKLGLVISL